MPAKQRRQPAKDFSKLDGMRAALYCRVSHIDKRGDKADEKRRAVDEKSVDDQEREGRAWAERAGVELVEIFRDEGLSASAFSAKGRGRAARPGFDRLLGLVEASGVDVVWVWAIDRSNRDLRVFTEIRDVFQDHQVALVVSGRLHDPSNYDDWMMLGFTSQFSERFSFELSKNVRRGQASSAAVGKPHAPTPYGYRRRYAENRPEGIPDDQIWIDKHTKQFVWQEPNIVDGNDHALEDTPAYVVREIFERLAKGEPANQIRKDLNRREIPAPGTLWQRNRTVSQYWLISTLLRIARNPAYIGRRVYQGKTLKDVNAMWPPLVSEDLFWAVQRVLTDPARQQKRPARGRHLLTHIARCAVCGNPMGLSSNRPPRPSSYSCAENGCTAILEPELDDYVEEVVVKWLSDPDVAADLTQDAEDAEGAVQARADADRARVELEEWRQLAEAGEVSPPSFARAEKGLLRRIEEAEKRGQAGMLPPVLVGNIGPQAKAGWAKLDLAQRRQIISAIAAVRVVPVGRGYGRGKVATEDRVEWRWLLGPGRDDGAPLASPPKPQALDDLRAARRREQEAARQQRRERALALRRQGLSYEQIGRELGVTLATAWLDIRTIEAAG